MELHTLFYILAALSFAAAATAPGGFVEKSTTVAARPLYDLNFVPPNRGAFTFPAPYNTKGYRITEPADGTFYANGYSYWAKINQHKDDDIMYVMVGSKENGPVLYSINKITDEVLSLGSAFPPNNNNQYLLTDELYFAHDEPYSFYHPQRGTSEWRKTNFKTNESVVIFDTNAQWHQTVPGQVQSSFDGQVHSFTLKSTIDYSTLGCGLYFVANDSWTLFEFESGALDECQVDKSGEYLMIKADLEGGVFGNRFIELKTGRYVDVLNPFSLGHSDTGYRYAFGAGNQDYPPGANAWLFDIAELLDGAEALNMTLVYNGVFKPDLSGFPNHYTWQNAKEANIVPIKNQFACGSWADPDFVDAAKCQEILCFRMDDSLDVLIVAPVMTWMNATGGDINYYKAPKAVIDFSGDYILWSTNLRSDRLDLFVAQVPWQLLVSPSEYNPTPTAPVTIDSPSSSTIPLNSPTSTQAPKPHIAATSIVHLSVHLLTAVLIGLMCCSN